MEDLKTIRMSISFTEKDVLHCLRWIKFVGYLLDPESDDVQRSVSHDDIVYLDSLLSREYALMRDVMELSGGSDNVI